MLSADSTRAPLTDTSAKVSRPWKTISIRSRPRSAASATKVDRYSQSVFSIHCSAFSLVPVKGSGIFPARRRSVWTHPGTSAGIHSPNPGGPFTARSDQGPKAIVCPRSICGRAPRPDAGEASGGRAGAATDRTTATRIASATACR